MYYKLKSKYLLRGWNKLPTGVVDTELGYTFFLPKEKYIALRMCNGVIDSSLPFVSNEARSLFEELEKDGYVEAFKTEQEPTKPEQDYIKYDNRFIRSVHWSITGRCNYNCRHCFMCAPDALHPEMSFEDCKKIIEQFKECGVFGVQLTGGEALVHPHFWEIVDLLLAARIKISAVYSNGFLINESFFEKCEKRGIKPCISLSFDGTGGWHEWLRNVPDSLEHITRALDLCKEHGFRTVAEFCLHSGNKDELAESMRFLQEHGCSSVKINPLADMGRGLEIKGKMIPMSEMYAICEDYVTQYSKDALTMEVYAGNVLLRGDSYAMTTDRGLTPDKLDTHVVCGHARNELCISPDGIATPCATLMDTPIGRQMPSIIEKGMKQVLEDSIYVQSITFTLGEYFEKYPNCRKCKYVCQCAGGCRAASTDEDGKSSWSGKDRTTCDFYLGRERDRMEEVCVKAGFKNMK